MAPNWCMTQAAERSRRKNGQQWEYSMSQKCRVERCMRNDCQLPTHLSYKHPCVSPTSQNSTSPTPSHHYSFGSPPRTRESTAYHELSNYSPSHSGRSPLPVPPTKDYFAEYEDLITETGDLLIRFFRNQSTMPPLVTSHLGSGSHDSEQAAQVLASMEPIYRTTVMAFMRFCEIKEQTSSDVFEDRLTCWLYTSLVQHCQHALQDPGEDSIDFLILAVIAICLFDIHAGRLDSLRIHHTGLAALTSKIGGYHNLGLSSAHALWADRLVATVLSQKPVYPGPSLPVSAVRPAIETVYGLHFEKPQSTHTIRPDVLATCKDAGHLMDVLEVLEFSKSLEADSWNGKSGFRPSFDYFFFIRDAVEYRLVQMLANCASYNWQEECTLLAAKIVQNTIASVECVPAVNSLLSARIWSRIHDAFKEGSGQDSVVTRHESTDIMLWVLFASALPRNMSRAHRRWLHETISRVANLYFRRPVAWQTNPASGLQDRRYEHEQLLESIWYVLCRFIWCSELRPRFMEICNDMSDYVRDHMCYG